MKPKRYSLLAVLLAEYKAIFTNKLVVMVVIIGSLVYGLLYPMPYQNDIVTKQRLVIIDEDSSALSKQLIFLISATPEIALLESVPSLESAQALIESFQADGALLIPEGFEANAKKGVGTILSYMGNASYFLVYGAIAEGVHNAIEELSQRLRKQRNPDLLSTELVHLESIPLYNPSLGYINYALAAVLVFILHQTAIAGAGILSAYQNAIRKRAIQSRDLAALGHCSNTASALSIVSARILAFSSIYVALFALYFGVFFPLFGVSHIANASDFWCFSLMFIACCVASGVLLGSMLEDESLPTQVIFISSMPLVFILGFIWPSELLPRFLQGLGYMIPAFHGVRGLISLNQMGASFADVREHFTMLLVLFGFCFVASVVILHIRIKKARDGLDTLQGSASNAEINHKELA